MNGKLIIDLEV